jgi:hypothetical protein
VERNAVNEMVAKSIEGKNLAPRERHCNADGDLERQAETRKRLTCTDFGHNMCGQQTSLQH